MAQTLTTGTAGLNNSNNKFQSKLGAVGGGLASRLENKQPAAMGGLSGGLANRLQNKAQASGIPQPAQTTQAPQQTPPKAGGLQAPSVVQPSPAAGGISANSFKAKLQGFGNAATVQNPSSTEGGVSASN